jgi:hypothetical protein
LAEAKVQLQASIGHASVTGYPEMVSLLNGSLPLETVAHHLQAPEQIRTCTVEHVFGTLKGSMGATDLLTRYLRTSAAEMSLHVPAYDPERIIGLFGVQTLLAGFRT